VEKEVKKEGDNFDELKGKNQRYAFFLFPLILIAVFCIVPYKKG